MSVLYGNGFIGIDIAYDEDCISPIGWGRMLAHVHKIIGGPYDGKWFGLYCRTAVKPRLQV